MAKENEKKVIESVHMDERKTTFGAFKQNTNLSTAIFIATVEEEKQRLLTEYSEIYGNAIKAVDKLKGEITKLKKGKTVHEMENGELTGDTKTTLEDGAAKSLEAASKKLKELYTCIDNAMSKGQDNDQCWSKLKNVTPKQ